MRYFGVFFAVAALALALAPRPAGAIDVSPDGLTHYSHCVSQAKESNSVQILDRHILYRCHEDVAVSYFDFLGRTHVRDRVVNEPMGLFVYRNIEDVGHCWKKIADADGAPIALYGCDVYVEI